MGKVATSPLPSRGSPPLHSRGGNQKWPTSGQSGYVTPAVSGSPTTSEPGGEIRSGPQVGKVATSPLPSRGSPALQGGGEIRSGPLVGKVPTSPLPSRGFPPLQSGGGNQKWPTCGQSGYVTPAVSGMPTTAQRGGKSQVAHLWAKWLRHPYRFGDPHFFRAGGGDQNWPTSGQSGYITVAVSGIPTASQRGGGGITSGPLVGKVATSPLPSRRSPPLQSGGGKSEVAHLWAKWLRHPCHLGDPHHFTAGGEIRSGPQVGKVATSPLPSRGAPPLQSRGEKSEVAHKWAKWLRHPCRLGDPQHCRAGGKSEVAHLWAKCRRHPCRLGDSHNCRAGGGGNQKWPTCGQSGHVTTTVSGIPGALERGGKIRSGP